MSPAVKQRQKVERAIINQFVKDALAQGYRLAVSSDRGWDVDEMLLGSTDRKKIVDAAMEADDAHIFVQNVEGPTTDRGAVVSIGWVYIVLGNDGWDVISDYTTNLESLLEGANKLSDKYSQ